MTHTYKFTLCIETEEELTAQMIAELENSIFAQTESVSEEGYKVLSVNLETNHKSAPKTEAQKKKDAEKDPGCGGIY